MTPELEAKIRKLQTWSGFTWQTGMTVPSEFGHTAVTDVDSGGHPYENLGAAQGRIQDPLLAVEHPANWGFLHLMILSLWPDVGTSVDEYFADAEGFKKGDRPWTIWDDPEGVNSRTFQDFNLGLAMLDALLAAIED